MNRTNERMSWMRLGRTASILGALALAACGGPAEEPTTGGLVDDGEDYRGVEEIQSALDDVSPDFKTITGVMTINLDGGDATKQIAVISKRSVDSAILVNGHEVRGGGVLATTTNVKRIKVNGQADESETVIVDFLNGVFGSGSSAGVGIDVALLGDSTPGVDDVRIRGTKTADTFTVGASGSYSLIATGTDGYADIRVAHVAAETSYVFSLGAGADTLVASSDKPADDASRYGTSGDFAAGLTVYGGADADVLTGSTGADSLYGDEGNDVLRGRGGADRLYGEAGDDTFDEGTAANGADFFNGGAGKDTVTYASRTDGFDPDGVGALTRLVGVTVVIDGTAASGLTDTSVDKTDPDVSEGDSIMTDVEVVIGTDFDDVMTGGAATDDTLFGGKGNDKFNSTAGSDSLNGDDGNDWFVMSGAGADGADTVNGGAGSDTVDYRARTAALTISLDGVANDGVDGELDNVKADVENVIGGQADDVITGSAGTNVLVGLNGNDVLDGGAGDDIFLESVVADLTVLPAHLETALTGLVLSNVTGTGAAANAGTGADVIIGNTGTDVVVYVDRAVAITGTMDASIDDSGAASEGDFISADVEDFVCPAANACTVIGNALNNRIWGSSAADSLSGADGDDELHGNGNTETLLSGGNGDDLIEGVAATSVLCGAGSDVVVGGIAIDPAQYATHQCELN